MNGNPKRATLLRFLDGVLISVVFAALLTPLTNSANAQAQSNGADVSKLYANAQKALNEHRYSDAETDLKNLLRLGQHSAAVYSNLGVAYLHTGKLELAIESLQKAKSLAPSVSGVRLNLGLAYLQQRDFENARQQFADASAMEPSNGQIRYLHGLCAFMTDHFQESVDAFAPIYDTEKDDLEYLFMLGISHGMLKQTEQSQQTFAQLVKAGGDTPHLHLLLGKAYLSLEQLDGATAELRAAAAGDTIPYAHYYLAILAQKRRELDQALIEFEKEATLFPTNPWAFKEAALIRMDKQHNESAIRLLKTGIRNNPESPELFATLGRAYLQIDKPADAVPVLQKAISMDRKNSRYHYLLSRAYKATGHSGEAEAEAKQTKSLLSERSESQMEHFSRDTAAPAMPQ